MIEGAFLDMLVHDDRLQFFQSSIINGQFRRALLAKLFLVF